MCTMAANTPLQTVHLMYLTHWLCDVAGCQKRWANFAERQYESCSMWSGSFVHWPCIPIHMHAPYTCIHAANTYTSTGKKEKDRQPDKNNTYQTNEMNADKRGRSTDARQRINKPRVVSVQYNENGLCDTHMYVQHCKHYRIEGHCVHLKREKKRNIELFLCAFVGVFDIHL